MGTNPPPAPNVVSLPTWTDAASVTTYITSIAGAILGIITAVHPGFSEGTTIQSILPSVGFLIAAGAQIVNVYLHRSVQKAAILAGLVTSYVRQP